MFLLLHYCFAGSFQIGSIGKYCCMSFPAVQTSICLVFQCCMSELLPVPESMLPGLCMPRNFPIAHHSGMSLSAFHSFRMLLFQPVLVCILQCLHLSYICG